MALITWNAAVNGNWSQGRYWVGSVAPKAGDDALIDVGGAFYTVTVATAVAANALTLDASQATLVETTGSLTLKGTLALEAGTFQLNRGTTTVGDLVQSGGVLSGPGRLTVSGTTALSGGGMEGGRSSGKHGNLLAAGPLFITGTTELDGGWTLTAEGTTEWTAGHLYLGLNPAGGGAIGGTNTFVNAKGATFEDQNTLNYQIIQETGTGVFDNLGTFDKTVASGASTTAISARFDNRRSGTLAVDAGTLDLTGGGTESGTLKVAAGAALEFGGGNFTLDNVSAISSRGLLEVAGGAVGESGKLAIGGTLAIAGGALTAAGTIATENFFQSAGSLAGNVAVTVSGTTVLSGGGMEGGGSPGKHSLTTAGPLFITGSTELDGGWTLTAKGITEWTGGHIYLGLNPAGGGAIGGTNTFVNAKGATFDDENTSNFQIIQETGTGVFDNLGIFDKTVASGGSTTAVSARFDNSGTIAVDAGTLNLTGGGTESGTLKVAAGAALEFGGGNFTLGNVSAISSRGLLEVAGGAVRESGALAIGGTLAIAGGALTAAGTIATADFVQSAGSLAGNVAVTVSGTTVLSGGGMEGGGSPGKHSLTAAGPLFITGGTELDGGWTLTAEGITEWTGGHIYFGLNPAGGGAIGGTNTFVNAKGATFDDQNTSDYQIIQESGTGVFDNLGLFDKTVASGASTTFISAKFENGGTGTLEVHSGTLELTGTAINRHIFEAADGGTLVVEKSLTGAGTLKIIGPDSEIELGGATSENTIFAGGTLRLDAPASYTGTIEKFAKGDILELAGTSATTVTPHYNSRTNTTVLTVDLANGGPLTFTLAGNYGADTFAIASLNGNSNISMSAAPPGPITWNAAVNGNWSQGRYWVGSVAPKAGDDALIDVGGAFYTVTVATAVAANALTLDASQATLVETTGSLTLKGTLALEAGTFQLNRGTTTVGDLVQSGGVLSGPGRLTVSGTTALSGGGMEGGRSSGKHGNLLAAGPLFITGTTELDGGWTLTAEGTTEWTAGHLYLGLNPAGGGAIGGTNTFVNAKGATFEDQNTLNYQIIQETGTGVFDNLGTFDKTVASGASTTAISARFDNRRSGTLAVDAGTLDLTGGGTESGTLKVAAGAALEFGGGNFTLDNVSAISSRGLLEVAGGAVGESGKLAIGGTLAIAGGALTAAGTIATENFFQSAGSLAGNVAVTVSGTTVLSGGGMEGGGSPGKHSLTTAGPLFITGSTELDGGWTLTAKGITEWTGGHIYLGLNPAGGGAIGGTNTFVNAKGATFDDENTSNFQIIQETGTGVFDNLGIFDKTVASGGSTTAVSARFDNSGTIAVDAGTLNLTGGGTESGTLKVAAGAALEFGGGNFTLGNVSAISSRGLLEVAGGAVRESGALAIGGTLAIAGGALTAAGTIATADFVQSAGSLAGNVAVTVSGTTVLSGGGMEGGGSPGKHSLTAAGPLFITGGTELDGGWTLTAEGITEWTAGHIYFGLNPAGGGAIGGTNTFVNAKGATFDDQNTSDYQIIQESGTGVFDNLGLFDKTVASGASTTFISAKFENGGTGTLEVHSGTLELTGTAINRHIFEAADGGTLVVEKSLTGAGTLKIIGPDSEIELGGATSENTIFAGGTLRLDAPASYTGTIEKFAKGDILELAGTSATTVTPHYNSRTNTTVLTVDLANGGPLTFTLAGNYGADAFAIASFNGNSFISIGKVITQPLAIEAPRTATVGVKQTGRIGGVSISESPTTRGETFTVTLHDANGTLAATGGVQSNGGTTLTISGSLQQVEADLKTLTDTSTTPGRDTITIDARDSNGGTAKEKSVAVTVNGLPAIAAPGHVTVDQSKATGISGIRLSESGNTKGETFTVTLHDANGVLAATGGTPSNGGTTLTLSGSLQQVNAELKTLTDTDASAKSDIITINARDSLGNHAAEKDISVHVKPTGRLAIHAPAKATIGVGHAGSITGVSLSETNPAAGETVTVTLHDSNGVLAATGGVPSHGGTTLTISGSLQQVNADLETLTDTDASTKSDTIRISAHDSNHRNATQSVAVTVNGRPAIAAPGHITVHQNKATGIAGIRLSESGNTSGETFTLTLSDAHGVLAATGGVPSHGGTTLTMSGSLQQVEADLRTLTDTETKPGSDTITINAIDSFGNHAAEKSVAVKVEPKSGKPVLTAPPKATIGVGRTGAIAGIGLSEKNPTSGETFTVTLHDANSTLAATGGVPSNGGTTLTISGSLQQVEADLKTLTDTSTTPGRDTITIDARDSNGGTAKEKSVAVTVNGLPAIAAPGHVTVDQSKATGISGIRLSESGNTKGETFTVTLHDANGVLAATGGTPSNGGTTLTLSGSLQQVNAELKTLTDTDASAKSDIITINARDSLGNHTAEKSVAVKVEPKSGKPVLTAPAKVTLGVGRTGAIAGIGLSEKNSENGETFIVTLHDAHGVLAATGGVASHGGTTLTISGSLQQVAADLKTLTDISTKPGSDTVTIDARDSNGLTAKEKSVAVTVNGRPVITAPGHAAVAQNKATGIAGIRLSESGNTTGETFTVTLHDSNGVLAATGGVPSNGGTTLTISGSLQQVEADLKTLTDTDAKPGSDTITINANDSFGNHAAEKSIRVRPTGPPVIHAPRTATIGVGQTGAIVGIGLSETNPTAGETFTVTLHDATGILAATDGVASHGGTTLTLSGSLQQVAAGLKTLTDISNRRGSETITINARDSNGGTATPKSVAVTVNGPPAITAPSAVSVNYLGSEGGAIHGVSLSETGNTTTSDESFTVVLRDRNGVLAANTGATGGGGTILSSNGGKTLTISGTLAEVNADLTTLAENGLTSGSDRITIAARDSFHNAAAQQTIAVTLSTTAVSELSLFSSGNPHGSREAGNFSVSSDSVRRSIGAMAEHLLAVPQWAAGPR